MAAVLLTLAIVLVVVAGVVAIAVMVGTGRDAPPPAPVSAASSTDPQPSGSPSESTDEPGLTADELGMELDGKISRYRAALDDDSHALWEQLEYTDYNQTAVQAYVYFLIDMKSGLIWGAGPEDIARYEERIAHLEELLMDGEPLGDDVTITLEDRTFTYDGDTGEGGWTDN